MVGRRLLEDEAGLGRPENQPDDEDDKENDDDEGEKRCEDPPVELLLLVGATVLS